CHLPLPFSFLPLFFFTINYLYTLTFLISFSSEKAKRIYQDAFARALMEGQERVPEVEREVKAEVRLEMKNE
ncbi:MAG: hypothetical protein ACXQTR_06110, partial [Candidatus Methanospirareceae archaeon]